MPKTNTIQRIEGYVPLIDAEPVPVPDEPPAIVSYIGQSVMRLAESSVINLLVEARRAAKRILPELVDLRPFSVSNALSEIVAEKPRTWQSGFYH